jgi:hypothetical protein
MTGVSDWKVERIEGKKREAVGRKSTAEMLVEA